MSPVARAGGVALSLVAHVAVAVLLLTLSAADWSRPLFVDLVERAEAPGAPGAGTPPQAAPAARSHERSAPARARAPRAPADPARAATAVPPGTSARTAAAPPLAPSVEPGPPPPPAVATLPPPPAPVVPLAPGPAPADASPTPVDSPGPPASPAAASPAAPDAPARGGGETRGDAPSSRGGARGSALALGSPGGAGAIPAEYGPYLQRFRQRVQESLVYPLAARRQGLRGTVELDVWLDPAGRVRDVQVTRSSSHALLDDAAVETIRRLGPLPFPESLPRRALRIRLPLVFELR